MEGQTNARILKNRFQRALRRNSTDAERALWEHLRGRQMQGAKFRRQHPFGDYILDFVCLERRVVIELDGGQHTDAIDYDARRTHALELGGFIVLRFWNHDIIENTTGVLELIWKTMSQRATPSPPLPPLEGEG